MADKTVKKINVICHACAEDLKSPYNKWAIWIWEWLCDVCWEIKAVCNAYHDYGIDEDGNIISEQAFKTSNSL